MQKKQGVLMVNLGTPASTQTKDVRSYLAKFLSDQRVIKNPKIFWLPILHGMILRTRPKKSAELYKSVWSENGSPLLHYALKQQENLQTLMPDVQVEIAMSYSEPSIPQALDKLLSQSITKITVIPMYPQYSGTTVGSVFDEVMKYFAKSDKIVDLHFIHSYCEDPDYISYQVKKIRQALEKEDYDALLFSYHGIPLSYAEAGDKYPEECRKTTELIMQQLGEIPYYHTYQSKFGPSEWLKPATDETLKSLPSKNIKKIMVISPSFVADCLETLHELEIENKEYFMENGGTKFTYLSPYNDDIEFAELMKKLVN
ncbi:MAG: ferrochelatase [Streptococcaceae bacterium]|jgi:ferrochelatase|nr:ferrochelatase [Streptococcaceae bacterium]